MERVFQFNMTLTIFYLLLLKRIAFQSMLCVVPVAYVDLSQIYPSQFALLFFIPVCLPPQPLPYKKFPPFGKPFGHRVAIMDPCWFFLLSIPLENLDMFALNLYVPNQTLLSFSSTILVLISAANRTKPKRLPTLSLLLECTNLSLFQLLSSSWTNQPRACLWKIWMKNVTYHLLASQTLIQLAFLSTDLSSILWPGFDKLALAESKMSYGKEVSAHCKLI